MNSRRNHITISEEEKTFKISTSLHNKSHGKARDKWNIVQNNKDYKWHAFRQYHTKWRNYSV